MMTKTRAPRYQCTACASVQPKWTGQCADCGAWNSLEEVRAEASMPRSGGRDGAARAQPLADIQAQQRARQPSGLGELDRALGGGIVAGSVVLIGGDPGIGKSTLLLQALAAVELTSLYVSGEESAEQIALRARRLGLERAELLLLAETALPGILATANQYKPQVMVIDSIQTVYSEEVASAPGSVTQVRECAAQLVQLAKHTGTTIFLVGHVTKEGALAGPRVLEHMVDTVLYFEGDTDGRYRALRAVKNRYGAVNELGVFAMTEQGLKGVQNPSAIFLSRHPEPVAGSVVMVTREGTRPLLVEAQALVDESPLANPRRVAVGLDQQRLAMLIAVLHRHGGVAMFDQDVFVNVVGGVRVTETAADLPVLLAALSSFKNRPLPPELIVFGEVGLAGEIRPVPQGQERLREAAKQGFKRALIPQANAPKKAIAGIEVTPVQRLQEALAALA